MDGRAHIPGRFAVDWVLLDAAGRHAGGDPDTLANWYGYGTDVPALNVVVDFATSVRSPPHPDSPTEEISP